MSAWRYRVQNAAVMIFPLFCNSIWSGPNAIAGVLLPIVDAIGVDDFPFSRLILAQKDLVSFINNFRARLSAWAFDSDALHRLSASLNVARVICMLR